MVRRAARNRSASCDTSDEVWASCSYHTNRHDSYPTPRCGWMDAATLKQPARGIRGSRSCGGRGKLRPSLLTCHSPSIGWKERKIAEGSLIGVCRNLNSSGWFRRGEKCTLGTDYTRSLLLPAIVTSFMSPACLQYGGQMSLRAKQSH
jgi:hypothetical protein